MLEIPRPGRDHGGLEAALSFTATSTLHASQASVDRSAAATALLAGSQPRSSTSG